MNECVFVLGGDGFCGWPTSLHLANKGFKVVILDNLSRRNIDNELGTNSLTPILSIDKRIDSWNANNKEKEIEFHNIDLSIQFTELVELLKIYQPNALIHFAEQRAAPYSMKSHFTKNYTINNNINATHNVLNAIVSSKTDTHLIHLGTMGVYGYTSSGLKIPEGYLDVKIPVEDGLIDESILYPTNPGSIYHLTKSMDQLLFAYYNKNDNLKITDLHQGIVWGTQTKETSLDESLTNRFDYDGDYGTVLNRFLVQSCLNYPLTVHGVGGQTRAFIHIQDTVNCIFLALMNPPSNNEKVKILNQVTETHRVIDLAKMISKKTNVSINFIDNPRNEAKENDLNVSNDTFLGYGLKPIVLEEGLLDEIRGVVEKYISRIDKSKIPALSKWKS